MKKKIRFIIIIAIIITVGLLIFFLNREKEDAAVTNQGEKPTTQLGDLEKIASGIENIVYEEEIPDFEREEIGELPDELDKSNTFCVDFRHYDLSDIDLENYDLLEYATFDTDTVWPDNLPEDYDPERIMELGEDPGLGIRALHEEGIDGSGVNIAIIDTALLLDHQEYEGRIMSYELLHNLDETAQMHGTCVTSIAVGENVGVAPGAKVYYIASTFGNYTENGAELDLSYMAEGIRRVLEINESLPEEEKIRVISISSGGDERDKGYESVVEAIEEARSKGVFVITCSPEVNYGFSIMGLGRDIYEDPDMIESYGPGILQQDWFEQNNGFEPDNILLVPMDSRTYAFCTGTDDYTFQRQGGISLATPWLAGLYALCLQVDPDMTETEFIEAAFETGDVVSISYNYKAYKFGTIINPEALVHSLQEK